MGLWTTNSRVMSIIFLSDTDCMDSISATRVTRPLASWTLDVLFFITKSRKDETTKICSKHFVLFRFRVFVIVFLIV